jgi:hypothetical protein
LVAGDQSAPSLVFPGGPLLFVAPFPDPFLASAVSPRGSRVSADYKFYYALRANGCDVVIPCMGTDELADYILTKFRPEYILGREQALNGRFTNKTVVVSTIGVKPVDVPGWLDRFIRLERLMPENNFYTDIKKVE